MKNIKIRFASFVLALTMSSSSALAFDFNNHYSVGFEGDFYIVSNVDELDEETNPYSCMLTSYSRKDVIDAARDSKFYELFHLPDECTLDNSNELLKRLYVNYNVFNKNFEDFYMLLLCASEEGDPLDLLFTGSSKLSKCKFNNARESLELYNLLISGYNYLADRILVILTYHDTTFTYDSEENFMMSVQANYDLYSVALKLIENDPRFDKKFVSNFKKKVEKLREYTKKKDSDVLKNFDKYVKDVSEIIIGLEEDSMVINEVIGHTDYVYEPEEYIPFHK